MSDINMRHILSVYIAYMAQAGMTLIMRKMPFKIPGLTLFENSGILKRYSSGDCK